MDMDMWHNTPAQLMSEVLNGTFDGLQKDVEPREDSAYLVIRSEGESWLLTLQKRPAQEDSVENRVEQEA